MHFGTAAGWARSGFALALACACTLTACESFKDDDDPTVFNRVAGVLANGFVDGAHDIARFDNPVNVEVAPDGTVYVADFDNDAIRVIDDDGVVSTLVRGSSFTPPTTFSRPFGLTITPDGTLYVQTDGNDAGARDINTGTLWRVNRTTGAATVVARNLGRPRGLQAVDNNTIIMSDPANHVISRINPNAAPPTEVLLAGANLQSGYADAPLGLVSGVSAARFNQPYGLALLPNGSLLVADKGNHRLRQVTLAGVVSLFAGDGVADDDNGPVGPVTGASFNAPQDVAVSGLNIYVADHDNYLIRRINGSTVFTQAGSSGMRGFVDAEGTTAQFSGMEGLAIAADGATLWVADGDNGDDDTDPGNDNFHHVRRLRVP